MKLWQCGMFVSVLFIVAGWAITAVGQGGGGMVIPCEFDCYEIKWMGGRQNGVEYCWEFEELTGRLVWSNFGDPDGGTPVQQLGRQSGWKWERCQSVCDFWTEVPQELENDDPFRQITTGRFGFGNYTCSG